MGRTKELEKEIEKLKKEAKKEKERLEMRKRALQKELGPFQRLHPGVEVGPKINYDKRMRKNRTWNI